MRFLDDRRTGASRLLHHVIDLCAVLELAPDYSLSQARCASCFP
jgi:hypothetical protein